MDSYTSSMKEYSRRVLHGPPFVKGEEMCYVELRQASFVNWSPDCQMRPEILAKNGLYLASPNNYMKCYNCDLEVRVSDVEEALLLHDMGCKLYRSIDNNTFLRKPVNTNSGGNEVSGNDTNQHPSSDMSIEVYEEPKYPQLSKESERRATFYPDNTDDTFWPKQEISTAELIKAGFFYENQDQCKRYYFNDKVTCFHCAGTVRNWFDGDVPMMKHARCFPYCGFLRKKLKPSIQCDEYLKGDTAGNSPSGDFVAVTTGTEPAVQMN